MRYITGYDPIQQMWDKYRKIARKIWKKRKSTGYIYLPRSKLRESEGHLMIRPCLQDSAINYAPRIGK